MPVYVFACKGCHGTVEQLQVHDAPAPTKCARCGHDEPMTRVPQRTSARVQRIDLEDEGTQEAWHRHRQWMADNPDWAERNSDEHHQYREVRFG